MSELELHLKNLDFRHDFEIGKPEKNSQIVAKDSPIQPARISTSASFQTLLAQNEDLAARLRITLQSLSQKEEEKEKLQSIVEEKEAIASSLQDQVLVWREKEKIWRERESTALQRLQEKSRELSIEKSLMDQLTNQMEKQHAEIQRHKKYQEKIRTSVKPYVAQLKAFSKSLAETNQQLLSELAQKELENQRFQAKTEELKFDIEARAERIEREKAQLITLFEDDRTQLKLELSEARQQIEILEEKCRLVQRSLERQDELENMVVALRRSKDDLLTETNCEIDNLRRSLRDIESQARLTELQFSDTRTDLERTRNKLADCESQLTTTQEQLISLRYMWTQKSNESEQQGMTIKSLEKINLELSQKLNELRKELDLSS